MTSTLTKPANALIVVDVQNDFCPGGSLAVADGDLVAAEISNFIRGANDAYVVIVATKDWHPNDANFPHFSETPDYADTWPPHCIAYTDGALFHADLRAKELDAFKDTDDLRVDLFQFDRIFYKGQKSAAYSGFEGTSDYTPLDEYLKEKSITHVDIVGLATDYCVKATALDAERLGYQTTVFMTMSAGVKDESTENAIKDMVDAGIALEF